MDYVKEQLKAVENPLPQMQETLKEELSFLKKFAKGKIVLDVGCGNARPADKLAKFCKEIICIDNEKRMIKIAKGKLKGGKNTQAIMMDAFNMDFKNEKFDFVYSTYNTLGSINDKDSFLKESIRVLKSKGKIAIFTWKRDEITTKFMKEYYPSIGFEVKEITEDKADLGKCTFERLDTNFLKGLFEKQGLKNIEIKEIGPLWNVITGQKN